MAAIKLLPEYGLIYDSDTGKVAPESGNMVKYTMSTVMESLNKMEKYADGLMNSLAPTGSFTESWPNRTKSLFYASIFTNIFYGAIFGLVAAFLLVVLHMAGMI